MVQPTTNSVSRLAKTRDGHGGWLPVFLTEWNSRATIRLLASNLASQVATFYQGREVFCWKKSQEEARCAAQHPQDCTFSHLPISMLARSRLNQGLG
jgi:hypothetical protein